MPTTPTPTTPTPHKKFLIDCRLREIKISKEMIRMTKTKTDYEFECTMKGETPNPIEIEVFELNIEKSRRELDMLAEFVKLAYKAPDWLALKLHDKEVKMTYAIGVTNAVEKRIIKEHHLSKYGGLLLENNEAIKESLEDKVFRRLRLESEECGYKVDIKSAKEIALRVIAVVESPVDNKNIITFKNGSIDWKTTYVKEKVTWLPERVENHNPIKWDYLTKKQISESPKHMEMADYMDSLFKDWFKSKWRESQKLIFKIGAYAMAKDTFAYKIFFFEGSGGEGKSEVQLFIRKMFNDYSCKSYDPIKPILGAEMAFVGSQIVYNDDLTDGKLELKHIKSAATGGSIHIRPLYQQGGDHKPYATMLFNTNYGLKTGNDATSSALDSRVFILKFPGEDMRGTDKAKLYKKINPSENQHFMEVFVSRCVDQMEALISEEFSDEASKKINKTDAISSQNTVKMFIDEFDPIQAYWCRKNMAAMPLELVEGKYTTFTELFNYYMNWANAHNEFKVNGSVFRAQFEALSKVKLKVEVPFTVEKRVQRWIDLSPLLEKEKEVEND